MPESTSAARQVQVRQHAREPQLAGPTLRTGLVLIVDVAIVASGAFTLGTWTEQASGAWEVLAAAAFVGVTAILLLVRTVLAGRLSAGGASLLGAVREGLVVYGDIVGLVLLFTVWAILRQAEFAWACLVGASMLLVGSSVQLLLDVVLARNRPAPGLRRHSSRRLARSLEATRLAAAVVSMLVLTLVGALDGWDAQSVSELLVLTSLAIGISTLLRTRLPRRRAELAATRREP